MDCWGSVCTITMATTSMRATTFTTVRRHYKHVILCRVVDTDTRWVIILRNSVEHQYNILLYHMYGFSTLTTTLHILTINDAYHHFRCVDGKTCLRNHSNEGLYHVTHVMWVQARLIFVSYCCLSAMILSIKNGLTVIVCVLVCFVLHVVQCKSSLQRKVSCCLVTCSSHGVYSLLEL